MTNKPTASELRWVDPGLPGGPHNTITDVPGVLVGHTTLITGEAGPLVVGEGPVRTGVTVVLPHGDNLYREKVTAAAYALNAFGKSTGLMQINETGLLETPICLTSTLNVWRVADAVIDYLLAQSPEIGIKTGTVNPVVGECFDGYLNDAQGRHVRAEHVRAALDSASGGPIAQGNVGGGTGCQTYNFKSGIGCASRVVPEEAGGYTVGVLAQSNYGRRHQLVIKGVNVGRRLLGWPEDDPPHPESLPRGSCMMVIATDAPLDSRQLHRLARRAPLGMARTGAVSTHQSGDFVIAFSTARRVPHDPDGLTATQEVIADEAAAMLWLPQAVAEAIEEAILNSLLAAETMSGRDNHTRYALPVGIINEMIRVER